MISRYLPVLGHGSGPPNVASLADREHAVLPSHLKSDKQPTIMCLPHHQNTEWSRKIAQNLMQRNFATVCSIITRFSPKCAEIN